jgi:predicted SAM-dependent methyltransferase
MSFFRPIFDRNAGRPRPVRTESSSSTLANGTKMSSRVVENYSVNGAKPLPENGANPLPEQINKLFREATGWKVNVGCGTNPAPGWVNLDLVEHPGVYNWNCAGELPFDDGSVDVIFGEHFFEHLGVPLETGAFLMECRRCLKEGGVIRLVVPDAGLYLSLYSGGLDGYESIRPLRKEAGKWFDTWLGHEYVTKMELINAVFRQDGQHKFAYDAETLCHYLMRAGFNSASRSEFGKSSGKFDVIDNPYRRTESLYVEAIK